MATTSITIVYDDTCGMCRRSVRTMMRFDWLRRFTFLPFSSAIVERDELKDAVLGEGIRVLYDSGRVSIGINAVRSIMLRTVAGFLPALLLWLPGVYHLASSAYGWVARNRHRFGGEAVCAVPGAGELDAPTAKPN